MVIPAGWLIETWLTRMTAEEEPRLTGEKKKDLIGSCINFLKSQIMTEKQGNSSYRQAHNGKEIED